MAPSVTMNAGRGQVPRSISRARLPTTAAIPSTASNRRNRRSPSRPAASARRENGGKEQGLHDDFGVRVLGEPHLNDVQREESGGGGGRTTNEPRTGEIHGHHSEDRPDANRPSRAGQPVESVPDRD